MTVSGNSCVISMGYFCVGYSLDAIATLLVNDGAVRIYGPLNLGVTGGRNKGKSRIIIQKGVLQAEKLNFKTKDSKIIFRGGVFKVKSENLSDDGMKQLIKQGKLDVSKVKKWKISTKKGYTVLEVEQ
jgi:hypothetical protein